MVYKEMFQKIFNEDNQTSNATNKFEIRRVIAKVTGDPAPRFI